MVGEVWIGDILCGVPARDDDKLGILCDVVSCLVTKASERSTCNQDCSVI